MNSQNIELFAFGEIVKTRGLRGCLKIMPYSEAASNFADLKYIYIENSSGIKNSFKIKNIDVSGKSLFIELNEIADLESARKLIGCKVFLPTDMLVELSDGEYYWHDIIGLQVYTEKGEHLGVIESIFTTGSNDVYVCKGDKREILIPAIADVVLSIDINQKVMTIKLMEGL